MNWLVGAFYLKEDSHDNFFFNSDSADTQGAQFDFTDTTSRDADVESTAVFGQVTFPLGDNTRVTAGARYSHEENDWAINDQFGYYYDVPIPRDIRDIDLENGPFAIQGEDVLISDTFKPFTWRLAVDHDLSEDAMIYGYVATGYSSGGFNSRQNPENGLFTYPESETITYEIGYKSTLLDGAMTLNVAAYYNDFEDYGENWFIKEINVNYTIRHTLQRPAKKELRITNYPLDSFEKPKPKKRKQPTTSLLHFMNKGDS